MIEHGPVLQYDETRLCVERELFKLVIEIATCGAHVYKERMPSIAKRWLTEILGYPPDYEPTLSNLSDEYTPPLSLQPRLSPQLSAHIEDVTETVVPLQASRGIRCAALSDLMQQTVISLPSDNKHKKGIDFGEELLANYVKLEQDQYILKVPSVTSPSCPTSSKSTARLNATAEEASTGALDDHIASSISASSAPLTISQRASGNVPNKSPDASICLATAQRTCASSNTSDTDNATETSPVPILRTSASGSKTELSNPGKRKRGESRTDASTAEKASQQSLVYCQTSNGVSSSDQRTHGSKNGRTVRMHGDAEMSEGEQRQHTSLSREPPANAALVVVKAASHSKSQSMIPPVRKKRRTLPGQDEELSHEAQLRVREARRDSSVEAGRSSRPASDMDGKEHEKETRSEYRVSTRARLDSSASPSEAANEVMLSNILLPMDSSRRKQNNEEELSIENRGEIGREGLEGLEVEPDMAADLETEEEDRNSEADKAEVEAGHGPGYEEAEKDRLEANEENSAVASEVATERATAEEIRNIKSAGRTRVNAQTGPLRQLTSARRSRELRAQQVSAEVGRKGISVVKKRKTAGKVDRKRAQYSQGKRAGSQATSKRLSSNSKGLDLRPENGKILVLEAPQDGSSWYKTGITYWPRSTVRAYNSGTCHLTHTSTGAN